MTQFNKHLLTKVLLQFCGFLFVICRILWIFLILGNLKRKLEFSVVMHVSGKLNDTQKRCGRFMWIYQWKLEIGAVMMSLLPSLENFDRIV